LEEKKRHNFSSMYTLYDVCRWWVSDVTVNTCHNQPIGSKELDWKPAHPLHLTLPMTSNGEVYQKVCGCFLHCSMTAELMCVIRGGWLCGAKAMMESWGCSLPHYCLSYIFPSTPSSLLTKKAANSIAKCSSVLLKWLFHHQNAQITSRHIQRDKMGVIIRLCTGCPQIEWTTKWRKKTCYAFLFTDEEWCCICILLVDCSLELHKYDGTKHIPCLVTAF